jgi:lipoate-protein ligase A
MAIRYIESGKTDPEYNLALEQFLFDSLDPGYGYCMLWQNNNAIIVGKHQNTAAEINGDFVKEHRISVVRRLSGGGAVYHDLGNINFTFIADGGIKPANFSVFCEPIQKALVSMGVPAEISGRNDMLVEGMKISGNAQYVKRGRVMHHGTLLYDSDLNVLSGALKVKEKDPQPSGVKSVKSRVTNIRPYMKKDMTTENFMLELKKYLFASLDLSEYSLSPDEEGEVRRLKEQVYSQWAWNYGASPSYNLRRSARFEGCGNIEILADVADGQVINNIVFFGDFFSAGDLTELSALLTGKRLDYNELKNTLTETDVSRYFINLDNEKLLSLLVEKSKSTTSS